MTITSRHATFCLPPLITLHILSLGAIQVKIELFNYATLLDTLIIYVPMPYSLLLCRSCKVVLFPSRFPTHFSNPKTHSYTQACGHRLAAAFNSRNPRYPLAVQSEDNLANYQPPLLTNLAIPTPIPYLPIHYGFQCRHSDPTIGRRCS